MSRNSWILTAFLVSLLVVVVYRFEEYRVSGDYLIYTTAACDSTVEQCFVWDCDPEEDEECDTTPYKKLTVYAGTAPACALEHTCENFECSEDDSYCEVTLCSEDALEEGEVCMDIEVPEAPEAEESRVDSTEEVGDDSEVSEESDAIEEEESDVIAE